MTRTASWDTSSRTAGSQRHSPPFKEALDRSKVERARIWGEHHVRRRGAVDPEDQREAREKALELIQLSAPMIKVPRATK